MLFETAVIGIQNPGSEYAGTRHNIGGDVVAEGARVLGAGEIVEHDFSTARMLPQYKTMFVTPHTYVNVTGSAVSELVDRYAFSADRILLAVDDFNIPLGRLRFRQNGSAGGHNGLRSVIDTIGSDFPRLRIGIGPIPPEMAVVDFVLGRFSPGEEDLRDEVRSRGAQALEVWLQDGMSAAMNKYNS
ncbi:MAG: aminoacyl-tRNA hydrolase [Fibrobacterota bacterium]